MEMNPLRGTCKYTAMVNCGVENCSTCGWNPVVKQARLKQIKRERAHLLKKKPQKCPLRNHTIAMQMFNYCKTGNSFDEVGRIIDYQTPLKAKRSDEAGKIDLLAYDGTSLHILELKKPDSEETMLRCVLEGYTYLKTVDAEKLLSDFMLPPDTKVIASPLVFKDGLQWAELSEDRPWLKQLMRFLESTPFAFDEHNEIVSRWPIDDQEKRSTI